MDIEQNGRPSINSVQVRLNDRQGAPGLLCISVLCAFIRPSAVRHSNGLWLPHCRRTHLLELAVDMLATIINSIANVVKRVSDKVETCWLLQVRGRASLQAVNLSFGTS